MAIVSRASFTWWCGAAIAPQNSCKDFFLFFLASILLPDATTWLFVYTCYFICAIYSDFGFERVDIDLPCTPVRGYNPGVVPSNCSEGHTYTVSSG